MYAKLLGPISPNCVIPEVYTIVKSVEIAGVKIGSAISPLDRSSYITAKWTGPTGEVQLETQWPGRIDHFLEHSIYRNGQWEEHLIAKISWFQPHPNKISLLVLKFGALTVTLFLVLLRSCPFNA